MTVNFIKVSKFLSLVLRHKPEEIGLTLDENGWANIEELIQLANLRGTRLNRALLDQLVAENDKQRFALSEDGRRIRASQGHSIDIDLALAPAQPPELLYHGTASRFIESIRASGLHSANRHHVHLSLDVPTATKVGQRHGKPVVLTVRSGEMSEAGHSFFLSANGVWLTERVPAEFIDFPTD
jgi:putative RNA 2'-phosphotransferase